MNRLLLVLALLAALAGGLVRATETENLGLRALPAPGKVTVDGKVADWDLSGGVLACGDAENQRGKFAVWLHLMYDAEQLYVLARWVDETPLNNPGSAKGDFGFSGDCLQFRVITADGSKERERCSHWTCWRDRDGVDVMDVAYGRRFNEGGLKDAQKQGATQEFQVAADGAGYTQELAIPWALLCQDGAPPPAAGGRFTFTVEPNFTIGAKGRLTVKDIFRAGSNIDRVFTFQASACWGVVTLAREGKVEPQPLRLADRREFAVHLEGGVPVVDWTGLVVARDLPGFKPLTFTAPADGYVSLIISTPDGAVVRHLLNNAFYAKGTHTVKWDGLSTPVYRAPGKPVEAGEFRWAALQHPGVGLRLRGWAANAGSAPWDANERSNWGGDHGPPRALATDGTRVFLGWAAAEAGKAVLACNLKGEVQWSNTHGGIGGAHLLAVDGGTVYVLCNWTDKPDKKVSLYRLEAKTGKYSAWAGTDSTDLGVLCPSGLAAHAGKLYLCYPGSDRIAVRDAANGQELAPLAVPRPRALVVTSPTSAVVLSGTAVLALDPATGATKPLIADVPGAVSLALGPDGRIFVGTGAPDHQVKVYAADGKPALAIGRQGGRPELGPWQPDAMRKIAGIVVDAEGKLWVAENTETPRRFSVWDTATGKFVRDFLGPTHYGASGGAISPTDPNLMAAEGCEWQLDPVIGRARCTGVFEPRLAGAARFCPAANGKLYLVTGQGMHGPADYRIYERRGAGDYRLRATIVSDGKTGTTVWADANDDAQPQPEEAQTVPAIYQASGYCSWSMFVAPDLSFIASVKEGKDSRVVRLPVAAYTACGAPRYAPDQATPAPALGLPSLDGKHLLAWTDSRLTCYSLTDGTTRWSFPNTFSGVHGSHHAPAAELGLLRGSFGVVGAAQLPGPVGSFWALNGNCGEWYLFNADGFFLAQLFQGDPMKVQWPEQAVPGAILDNVPPGLGGEDFGGGMTQGQDGKVYVQAGKTGSWNVEVVGLDQIVAVGSGTLALTAADVALAQGERERQLQAQVGIVRVTARKLTPTFTGDLGKDFPGAELLSFKKQEEAAVRAVVAYDDTTLYLGWEVKDKTPWVNGATDPAMLYLGGDTVDFQLGTDPKAKPTRDEAGAGDLRLSIGPCQGKDTAVLYRRVSAVKKPKSFSSGVVADYPMEFVDVLADARVSVKKRGEAYVVEAAVPLATLGLAPTGGLVLRGDFGATHAGPDGQRTRLRTHWSNQQTGLVDDAVFELKLVPKNWGEISFAP